MAFLSLTSQQFQQSNDMSRQGSHCFSFNQWASLATSHMIFHAVNLIGKHRVIVARNSEQFSPFYRAQTHWRYTMFLKKKRKIMKITIEKQIEFYL